MQNILCTQIVFVLTFRTILVHNMFCRCCELLKKINLYQNDRSFPSYLCLSKIHKGRKGWALILTYIHDRTILEVKIRYIVHTGHDITFVHQCTYLVYIVLKTSRNSQMTLCNSHQVTRIWWWENDTDTHCAVHPKLYIPSTIRAEMHIVLICFWVD